MYNPERAKKLRWTVAILLGLINISVFCIWIPARLQISGTYIFVNSIWDRIEKVLFSFLDIWLNIYFVYLIRSQLVENGLTKYKVLFYFNCAMICLSTSLDVSGAPELFSSKLTKSRSF